ncbi:MAG: sel1 repeat family protein [Verrucomicrobia bacterium]|nr:sel1 repeat family protein [Verrucomicrobiota bacterium]
MASLVSLSFCLSGCSEKLPRPKEGSNQRFREVKAKAEKGDAEAQSILGTMYQNGWGIKKNLQEAVKWYGKAAAQGNPTGQRMLGRMHEFGCGVARNDGEAIHWYRRAAEQGYPSAQYDLGHMCWEGKGIQRDYVEAYRWFFLSKIFNTHETVARLMTPEQIEEAKRRAATFVPRKETAPR